MLYFAFTARPLKRRDNTMLVYEYKYSCPRGSPALYEVATPSPESNIGSSAAIRILPILINILLVYLHNSHHGLNGLTSLSLSKLNLYKQPGQGLGITSITTSNLEIRFKPKEIYIVGL